MAIQEELRYGLYDTYKSLFAIYEFQKVVGWCRDENRFQHFLTISTLMWKNNVKDTGYNMVSTIGNKN